MSQSGLTCLGVYNVLAAMKEETSFALGYDSPRLPPSSPPAPPPAPAQPPLPTSPPAPRAPPLAHSPSPSPPAPPISVSEEAIGLNPEPRGPGSFCSLTRGFVWFSDQEGQLYSTRAKDFDDGKRKHDYGTCGKGLQCFAANPWSGGPGDWIVPIRLGRSAPAIGYSHASLAGG